MWTGDLIYHKFYKRYGIIKEFQSSHDPANTDKEFEVICSINWKSDGSGIALPKYVKWDDIELVDFKFHIRKANEQTNGKKTQSITLE